MSIEYGRENSASTAQEIGSFLSPEDQERFSMLRDTLEVLSSKIKNPLQFMNDKTVERTIIELAELYQKGKQLQAKG